MTITPLSVPAALSGKRILLTGATGFLAKVVLEKLIRTVPGLGGVVLLIRGGPDGNARERFQRQVASSSIFDSLRAERGAWLESFFAERIECLTGEITEPHFGLGEDGFRELASRTDLVVNAAASVNFREPLDQALRINTLSLRHLGELARAADAPLVQVSTCYVNGYRRGDIFEDEGHKDGHGDVEALIDALQRKIDTVKARYTDSPAQEDALTALGIREANRHGWNDTYTFTKWMGEQLAMRGMRGRPLTIVRPSIIESTLKGPVPGWLEGVKVADAVILAYARGRTSFFPARPAGIIDVIPADLVANAILLAAAEALSAPARQRIYQCCSGGNNPILVGDLIRLLQDEAKRNWRHYDKLFYKEPKHRFRVVGNVRFRLAMAGVALGALAWSGLRRLAGQPGATAATEKLRTTRLLAITFSFYAQPRYRFHNGELLALAARLGAAERAVYPVDARLIDWEDYLCRVHMAGLNRYALKRREERTPGDRVPAGAPARQSLAKPEAAA
ncbi:dehydrogenase [Massilia sp. WF1]|uniref:fatty acyl-CoA reductase n=1 Tax=unclassified Massilia TaxID=2609279 RepID=UPI00064B553C|nr:MULTISPECIES: fatty acyl-CoA reductase [unclassified Massilia]ALK97532.1 dehydrogenase [Massilia sp. WG5]KLU36012.1 dehydrogenase [Massilia sp. WF1]